MASLRETKDRIASVKSTLKITSAMKLVASSKLRKAQKAIENMRPYESTLKDILSSLGAGASFPAAPLSEDAKVAVVAISSNSSLCGGFNGTVIKKALSVIESEGRDACAVYPVGRKMADAMRKAGCSCAEGDWSDLIGHPSYDTSVSLASMLTDLFAQGRLSRILLVYNHFVSAAKQVPVVETLLPYSSVIANSENRDVAIPLDYIVEPSPSEVARILLPQVLMLRFHAAILDSAASEHAARTVAMQTATDNAQDLLAQLTLEYNKARQQKITAEILDLLGGAAK